MIRVIAITAVLLALVTGVAAAQDTNYTGRLDQEHPTDVYDFQLQSGQTVLITAKTISGDLDSNLTLTNSSGQVLNENDDRNDDSLDPALAFTAKTSGTYTVTVGLYEGEDNSGSYRLAITIGDNSLLQTLAELTAVQLSGPQKFIDTEHFRIHYTQTGDDAAKEDFAQKVAKTMEEVWQAEIVRMGWPAPPVDQGLGGDDRFDVYLRNLHSTDDGALGLATPGDVRGDNPNTSELEHDASSTTLFLENDFSEEADYGDVSAVDLMKVTAAHEFHHAVQNGFDADDSFTWYYEATATWMETQVYPKIQDAVGYVSNNYDSPEICFGSESGGDGLMIYGDWMFIQSLADAYGSKVVMKLWTNMAQYDGWAALEHTLQDFGDTVPQALARYRVQNLTRDYKFATYFGDLRVWMENDINKIGRWTFEGDGVEELGANYYAFRPSQGQYHLNLVDDNNQLELWAVGVRGKQADSIDLGRGGNITTRGYDYVYLMVFNPVYHRNLADCSFSNYSIRVTPDDNGGLAPVEHTWNARYFVPLKR